MPSAADVRAGAAYVEVTADDRKLGRGLAGARRRLRAFAAAVSDIGGAMLRATAVPLGALAISSRTFMGFSDQMSEVQAVTGAAADDFARLNEQAKELGRTTSFTARQVAEGMTELGRAGYKPDQIEAAIPSVLNLARATRTELGEAAGIAAAAMRGFGLEASDTTRIADVLTGTANNSAQTLSDLGESMKYVAPLAMEAGETIEDTAAALGVLANNGIKGSMAGTALARAYKNLATDAAQKTLAGIGVKAADAHGNLRKVADILADVGQATRDMGSAQRLSIFESLFGRGQAAALKLASGANFKSMRQVLEGVAGTAARTAKIMDDNLGGAWRRLASAAEGVQIALGEAISGTLARYMQALTRTAGRVTAWIKTHQDAVVSIALLIGKIAALGAGLLALAAAAKIAAAGLSAMMIVNRLIVGIVALGSGIGGVTGSAITFARVMYSLGRASRWAAVKTFVMAYATHGLRAAWAAFMALPIIIVFTAIAAAVMGLAYAMEWATRYTANLSTEMQQAREKGDQLRRADRLRMERLQQLAEKTQLTNAEQAEASKLVDELRSRYGDFGVTVNRATSALEGMTGAQERLNKAMRDVAAQQIQAELDEVASNINELAREAKSKAGAWHGFWMALTGRLNRPAQAIREIGQRMETLSQHAAELRKRLAALKSGQAGAVVGKEGPDQAPEKGGRAGRVAALQAAEQAETRLGGVRERLARQRRTDLENETADIRKLGEEYRGLLQAVIAGEEAKGAAADKDRLAGLRTELAGVDRVIDDMVSRATGRSVERAQREVDRAGADITGLLRGITRGRADREENRAIRGLIEQDPARAQNVLQQMLGVAEQQEQQARDALRTLWADARADGMLSEDEKILLDRASERMRETAGRTDRFRDLLSRAGEALANMRERIEVRGTFGSTRGMGYGSSAVDRTAEATEETAKYVKRIADNTKDGALAYGT